ncbi:hypothetical protein WUBG_10428, partial [Wuchereria bancrofti]
MMMADVVGEKNFVIDISTPETLERDFYAWLYVSLTIFFISLKNSSCLFLLQYYALFLYQYLVCKPIFYVIYLTFTALCPVLSLPSRPILSSPVPVPSYPVSFRP